METYPEKITVTITKEHCRGRSYGSNHDCPLCAAIRDAFPNTSVMVGGSFARLDHKSYNFPASFDENGWKDSSIDHIKRTGESFTLTLTRSDVIVGTSPKPVEEKPQTVRTVYVTVDQAVRELQKTINEN